MTIFGYYIRKFHDCIVSIIIKAGLRSRKGDLGGQMKKVPGTRVAIRSSKYFRTLNVRLKKDKRYYAGLDRV